MNVLQMPSGLRFLESLVTLIRNEDEIEKILGAVRKSYDEVNARISDWGRIEDIERLRNQAASEREKARVTLADAERKADQILKSAGATATTETEKRQKADDLIATYEMRLEKLEVRETRIASREREVQKDLLQARKLKASFDKLFD